MVNDSASIGVGNALLNGLTHIDLVRDIIPACPRRQLVNQPACGGFDVIGFSHTLKVRESGNLRKRKVSN
jgi:hypothetical protein